MISHTSYWAISIRMNRAVSTNEMYIRTLIICGKLKSDAVSEEDLNVLYNTDIVITELLSLYISEGYVNNLGTSLRSVKEFVEILEEVKGINNKQDMLNKVTKVMTCYIKHVKYYDILVMLKIFTEKLKKYGVDKFDKVLDSYKVIKVSKKRSFVNKDSYYTVECDDRNGKCELRINGLRRDKDFEVMIFKDDKVYFEDRETYDIKVIPQKRRSYEE